MSTCSCPQSRLHQRCRRLDVIQPTNDKTEFVWVVCNGSSPASPAHQWSNNRLIHCDAVLNGSWPWRLHRLGSVNALQTHVQWTVSRCFAVLRQLRTIRRQIPTAMFQSLITALVLSRLDYCNSVLFGLPANLTQRLQSVQNAAARLKSHDPSVSLITPSLIILHWLRIPERISFEFGCPGVPTHSRHFT